ncbi:MAG: type I-U CRISPR-associated protein Csx17 [Verrucomicrobiae bacterium]|nr:type I-U CRISPR-associated protein Csx17 [Verrucomicrobiae bacterium]
MQTISLSGCAPVPLAHYLKALGILRLVSEQKDPKATGRWHRDQFVLTSTLDREALLTFFLEEYLPTPVVAPWNGGSGFHPKDNSKALESLARSESARLQRYAAAVAAAQLALKRMMLGEKPTPEQKAELLLLCRNTLPEDALEWLDAAYVLTDDGAKYPPLLGTGGNDGRLEFTNNFMQRLTEVMDVATGKPLVHSLQRLSVALFADSLATPLSKAPIGQFLPGAAGGANATSGFDAASAVNPWDFILMIEGALLFASASVKRLESAETGALAYPFCVRQAGVGYASATSADESASRAEMWLPVWTQRAVTLAELSTIFSEGRSQVGTRAARNGVDFARAVVGLGVDRGLDEFQRYGFQVRNGLSYFATPLTRVSARKNEAVDLLSDVDLWLDRYRRAATKDTAPASARRALKLLESRIFDLCRSHTTERLSAVFIALGQCEATAARSPKWATAKENYLQPLFGLRKAWIDHALNSSVEFRLAASLASINGKFGKDWLPLRGHLEQVISYFDKESGTLSYRWADVPSNNVQWSDAALPDVLNSILARRLILSEDTEKRHEVWASLSDIKAFIERETNDALLSDLLWSMSLINWREKKQSAASATEESLQAPQDQRPPVPPTLYALLKLCFPPVQCAQREDIPLVPTVPAIHSLAAQGNGDQAAAIAIRRLRASGYHPVLRALPVKGDYARRTAAALLFPISDNTLKSIYKQTTRPEPDPANA